MTQGRIDKSEPDRPEARVAGTITPGSETKNGAVLRASELFAVGASHKTTPLEILESIALDPKDIVASLPKLRAEAGLSEVIMLSTCNRTEVYGFGDDAARASEVVEQWLVELSRARSPITEKNVFHRKAEDAVEHMFRVICGLDSMMTGETQIAGQVQDALALARDAGTAGPLMSRLLAAALSAQRRARSETSIGEGSVSVAAASVHLARRVFGDMSKRRVLVIGAGDTGRLAAKHFANQSPAALFVANRTLSRAEALARELNGAAVPLDACPSLLDTVDVALCATRSPEPVITVETIRRFTPSRSHRMLLLIDVSLPRNVDPGVSEIENVFLHDMYDLRRIVEANLSRRAKEVPAVERIIAAEVAAFLKEPATIASGPLIRELREQYEDVRRKELERFLKQFREEDRPIVERLTRDMINKLLHKPSVEIRGMKADSSSQLDLVRKLFGLDDSEGRRPRK